jgi:hypothetical protein
MSSEFEHYFELKISQNSTKFDQNFYSLLLLSQQRTFLLYSLKRSGSKSERVIGENSEWATASKTSAATNDTGQWRTAGCDEC